MIQNYAVKGKVSSPSPKSHIPRRNLSSKTIKEEGGQLGMF
jgi:hypothetical protein